MGIFEMGIADQTDDLLGVEHGLHRVPSSCNDRTEQAQNHVWPLRLVEHSGDFYESPERIGCILRRRGRSYVNLSSRDDRMTFLERIFGTGRLFRTTFADSVRLRGIFLVVGRGFLGLCNGLSLNKSVVRPFILD